MRVPCIHGLENAEHLGTSLAMHLRIPSSSICGARTTFVRIFRRKQCSRCGRSHSRAAATLRSSLSPIRRSDVAYATRLMNRSVVCRYSPTIPPRSSSSTTITSPPPSPSSPPRPSPGSCTSSQVYFHSLRGPLLRLPAAVHKNGQTPIRRSASVSLA